MMILDIIKYIFLCIFTLVLAIIFCPYRYSVTGKKNGVDLNIKAKIDILFGIGYYIAYDMESGIYSSLRIFGFDKKFNFKKHKQENANKHNTDVTREARTGKKGKPTKRISYDEIRVYLIAVLKLLTYIKPRKLSIHGQVGFEDPSLTGWLYGVLNIFKPVLKDYDIDIKPTFTEEGINGRLTICGRVWIPYIILVAAGILFTKPFKDKIKMKLKMIFKFKGGTKYVKHAEY
jgi:hypothetical protein